MTPSPIRLAVACLLLAAGAGGVTAQTADGAVVTPLAGVVESRAAGATAFVALDEARRLASTAQVRTGAQSWAAIEYDDGTRVTVKPETVIRVGGDPEGGVMVELGAVLVRARHLLDGEEHRVRSPVAVAAIRGTDFGVGVDGRGRTSVYVRGGKVAVSNVALAGSEVLVGPGQMTVVEPLRPPSPPAAYGSGEFEQLGQLGGLERAEDPVIESTELPGVESYLAFADPDIDALRNPAFVGQTHALRSTTLLSSGTAASHDWVDDGGGRQDAERYAGNGQTAQHVTIAPVGAGWVGLFAEGARDHSRATGVPHQPFEVVSDRRRTVTDQTVGRVRGLAGTRLGGTVAAAAVGFRRSTIDVDDLVLADGAVAATSATTNDILRLQLGAQRALGGGRLGVTWARDELSSTADADALHTKLTGHSDLLEGLYRGDRGRWKTATLLQYQRERTSEDFVDGGVALYREDRKVWSVRGGGGLGLTLGTMLVTAVDLVTGISKEEATQHLPAGGGVGEHEDDLRLAANLHVGVQAYLAPSIVLLADVHNQVARTRKRFAHLPNTTAETDRKEVSLSTSTAAATGVGWLHGGWLLQYLVQSGDAHVPVSHNLVLTASIR